MQVTVACRQFLVSLSSLEFCCCCFLIAAQNSGEREKWVQALESCIRRLIRPPMQVVSLAPCNPTFFFQLVIESVQYQCECETVHVAPNDPQLSYTLLYVYCFATICIVMHT